MGNVNLINTELKKIHLISINPMLWTKLYVMFLRNSEKRGYKAGINHEY